MYDMHDIAIIGGGINGAGIARDAAGRGLSVILVEQKDFAGATSSASSKLIHGGLRYLENYEFRMVREALLERERLLKIASNIIWPLDFILPHTPSMRPKWLIRLGLWLYDHLAPRHVLRGSQSIALADYGLLDHYTHGFSYQDCWVDDARLVLANVKDAASKGAICYNYNGCAQARRHKDYWELQLEKGQTFKARILVNATGVFAARFASDAGAPTEGKIRPVKGSHIVVPRLHNGEQAFILQQEDGRVVFVSPYEDDYSLIGTTDIPCEEMGDFKISEEEVEYLCACVNRYFSTHITKESVVWSYSGARALYDDGKSSASKNTRDYVLELDAQQAPILSVLGGKVTTYRILAEHALEKLAPFFAIHAKEKLEFRAATTRFVSPK